VGTPEELWGSKLRFDPHIRTGYLPVRDRSIVWGLVLALSATFKTADLGPVAAGLNVMLIVQLAPDPSEAPQVVADCRNSSGSKPVIMIPVIVSVVGRLFFTVTVLAALVVPTVWFAYARLAGVTDTGTRPVPVSVTVCGLLVALSLKFAISVSVFVVDGVNVKLIVQEA